jgi:hypothetical protein
VDEPGPGLAVAFVRSVAVLALPAEAQTEWLRGNGVYPSTDELALTFDDGFRLTPIFLDRGWLNARALPVLVELNEHLDAMSAGTNADLWHADSLPGGTEWNRVREWARTALTLLA